MKKHLIVLARDAHGNLNQPTEVESRAVAAALANERMLGRYPLPPGAKIDSDGASDGAVVIDRSNGQIEVITSDGTVITPRAPGPFRVQPTPTGELGGAWYENRYNAPRPGSMGGPSCPPGYDPALTPESYIGKGCDNPNYVCDKGRMLPPWISDSTIEAIAAVINDYTAVGTIGQMRAAFEALYALGEFDQTRYAAVIAGQAATATVNVRVPAVGFRIDWGVSLQDWSPFDLAITSDGFETLFSTQDLDRTFTVRVGKTNGGSIYVPFARRPVGVSQAQPAIGRAQAANATVVASALPAPIAAAFSMQVQLLTAFHPITAAFGSGLGVYEGAASA